MTGDVVAEGKNPPALVLGHEDAAIFELYVVPRYLALFGERLVAMLAESRDARVCHVHCRTGYPDQALLERLPNAHVYGCDPSASAIELARTKAATLKTPDGAVVLDYRVAGRLPLPFPPSAFSHALSVHPLAAARRAIYDELARVLAPRGQALVALPLRGSFVEVADLLRECALKHELLDLNAAVDAAVQQRPTADLFHREIEQAGFDYVEVDVQPRRLTFESGTAFFADPVSRLLLLPELRADVAAGASGPASAVRPVDPFAYVREAIDKYYRGRAFELTVIAGVASGRRA